MFYSELVGPGSILKSCFHLNVQKIMAFIAPKIIGGDHAPTPVGDLGLTSMTEALPLERVSWRVVGNDCLIEGYLPSKVK